MEWVAIAVTISRDPAVHRMAGALRVRVPEVVGLLALTFAEMTQHAADGDVANVPDQLLETWASWHGKRGAFAAQFRAELCNEFGFVKAWEKYNGANIRRSKAARARTKAWRERKDAVSGDGNRTHTETHNSAVPVCRTGQDKTGQDSSSSSSSADEAALLGGLPTDAQRAAWAAELAVAKEGMHGKPLTQAQIDVACRAYVGNGHLASPNLRHFRAFLVDAGRPPTLPRTLTVTSGSSPFQTPEMLAWAAKKDAEDAARRAKETARA